MKLVFDTKALSDLEAIYAWISSDSPSIAGEVVERVFSSIERLSLFPQMGRAGAVSGTREWVMPRLPYIVVYEVHDVTDELVVIAVFHGAQDRGPRAG
jgi:addiction module RelE/StbE family toxin